MHGRAARTALQPDVLQTLDVSHHEAPDQGSDADPKPTDHPTVSFGRVGVMLINLGTPESTGFWDVRRYLDEFLSDRRVIEAPAIIWQPILKGLILTLRPGKTAEAYKKVWRADTNESPLRYFTRVQAETLQERLDPEGETVKVAWAMRYGKPGIPAVLEELRAAGCDRILSFALYPQYSATTTATAYDATFRALGKMRWQPAIRSVGAYHDDPAYIEGLAAGVRDHLSRLDFEPEVILCSYHGLPADSLPKGDPYHCQCYKTTRLLREALGLPEDRLRLTFQSRFGPKEWLQPYTDVTLQEMAKAGIKRVAVLNPGFAADCLETLEEIGMEARELFQEFGGTHFAAIPCLNDTGPGMDVIEAVARRELSGWWQ